MDKMLRVHCFAQGNVLRITAANIPKKTNVVFDYLKEGKVFEAEACCQVLICIAANEKT